MVDLLGLFAAEASISIIRVPAGWRHPTEHWQFYGDKVGRTNLDWGAIYLTKNNEGKQELLFFFHFSIYILADDALKFWRTNYEKVLQHEMRHVEFYMCHLTPFLEKIEKKYFEEVEKLGADKAMENAEKRVEKYVKWVGAINKAWLDDMFGIGYRFWQDINDNWIRWVDDPFNKWLLNLAYCF